MPDDLPRKGPDYDDDFYAWTQHQAAVLRDMPVADNRFDREHVAEEIEDLGKSERDAVRSQIVRIIEHLLKLEYSGLEEPAGHWRREIVECRLQLEKTLTRSITAKLDLPQRYRASLRLLRELAPPMPELLGRIPQECPYSLDQIIGGGDDDWVPDQR